MGAAVQWVVLATQHLLGTGRVHLLVRHLDDDRSSRPRRPARPFNWTYSPAETQRKSLPSNFRVAASATLSGNVAKVAMAQKHRSRMRDVQGFKHHHFFWRSSANYKYNDAANYKYNDAAKMMSLLILSDAVVNFSSKAASPITCEGRQPTSASHPRHTARASTTAHTPLLSPPAVVPTLPDAG